MKAVIPILLIAGFTILFLSVYTHDLRKRLKGIDNPLVYLSRKERRAYARELLEREQEDYDLEQQERLSRIVWRREIGETQQ